MARMSSMIDFSMLGRLPRKPAIPILAGRMIKKPGTADEADGGEVSFLSACRFGGREKE